MPINLFKIIEILIFLYLVKKTISFFSENLITYDYDTYFKGKQFEIANFNIIEISKNLDISKENRRKILELVKENIIKREKKTYSYKYY